MSSPDRIAQLEQRIAELEGRMPVGGPRRRRGLATRLALIGLVVALTIPAGVVLANHQFSDVPTSSSIHDDVEALVEAGVTTGCGGGKYCPAAAVTRGQMAQFLNRLGALDGQAPSVNADRVDGRHANALVRVANWQTSALTTVAPPEIQYGPNLVITAPAAGFVTVNMGFSIINSSCTANCRVLGLIHHVQAGLDSHQVFASASTAEIYDSASLHRVFAVTAGVNTFQLLLRRGDLTNGTVSGILGTGTAMYTPFGSTGGSTLGSVTSEVDAATLEP